jgi:hypothetical protein
MLLGQYSHYIVYLNGKEIKLSLINLIITNKFLGKDHYTSNTKVIDFSLKGQNSNYILW